MANLTKEQAQQILGSRKLITDDGKYRLKVTNVHPYVRPDGTQIRICNFAAMTSFHVAQAKEAIAVGDYTSACNNGLSSSPRENKDFTPVKGEIVDVIIETVTTKSGVTGQFVTSMTPIATVVAKQVNTAQLFGANTEVLQEEESSVAAN